MSEPPIRLRRAPSCGERVLFTVLRLIGAEEALQIGLINRVLTPGHIERYACDMARKMATYAPLSLMQSKASVQLCLNNPELRGIVEPAALTAALYDTNDFHVGVQAFLSKQPLPPFRGR